MERFDFAPDCAAVLNPEFPGDGVWDCEVYGFARDGTVVPEIQPRWGAPLVVEVSVPGRDRWVGMFEANGIGGTTGLFATPDPAGICVVVDGLAYFVNIWEPANGAALLSHQVDQVVGIQSEPPLLLLVRGIDLVAVGTWSCVGNTKTCS